MIKGADVTGVRENRGPENGNHLVTLETTRMAEPRATREAKGSVHRKRKKGRTPLYTRMMGRGGVGGGGKGKAHPISTSPRFSKERHLARYTLHDCPWWALGIQWERKVVVRNKEVFLFPLSKGGRSRRKTRKVTDPLGLPKKT